MTRLLLCLMLGLALPAVAQTADPRPVISEVVQPDASLGRSFTGTVVARTEITLAFQTLGRIAARLVDTGDRVRTGQVLARLDPMSLDEDVTAAEAALAISEAQRVTATNALERAKQLETRGVASLERLEAAERTLAAATAAVDSATADLARARDARGYSDLLAPIDGVVTATDFDAGAVVSAGTPVMTLAGTGEHDAVIDLPEGFLAVLTIGDAFEVSLRGSGGPAISGTLRLVEPVADTSSRTRRVHLALTDPPPDYRIGSLVQARPLKLDGVTPFTLPASAILATDAGSQVWRVDPASRAVSLVPVTLDPRPAGDRVIVVSGLSPGDEIVTRGVHSLEEGRVVGQRME